MSAASPVPSEIAINVVEPDLRERTSSSSDMEVIGGATEKHFADKYTRSLTKRRMYGEKQSWQRPTLGEVKNAIYSKIPMIEWLPKYNFKKDFQGDLITGLTLGIMLIPQGMAYALLASLPPIYGLYSSIMPALVYMSVGSCKHMSVGPFALVSLLVAEGASSLVAPENTGEYIGLVMTMSFQVGLILALMAVLNLGVIVAFLADPVLSGFTTAAAFLIATSQLKHLVGFSLPRTTVVMTWYNFFSDFMETNYRSVLLGVFGIVFLQVMKIFNRKYRKGKIPVPAQLLLVIFCTLLVFVTDLDVKVLGTIPSGLPPIKAPTMVKFVDLLSPSLVVAIVTYVISISIAKTMGNKYDYQIDPNQELIALAVTNLVGAFASSYPSAGSLSRSAIAGNTDPGTPIHNLFCAVLICVVLLFLTPLLETLPLAALASIVFVGVWGMVNFAECKRLFKVNRQDCMLWVAAFCATFFLGVVPGIGISVIVSCMLLLKQTFRPSYAVLGRLPGTSIYRDVRRFEAALEIPDVKILRFGSSLNFANKDFFEQTLNTMEQYSDPSTHGDIHTVIVDASSINDIDSSSVSMLIRVAKKYAERDIKLLFANWKGPVRDILYRSEFHEHVPMENLFLSLHDAVLHAEESVKPDNNNLEPAGQPSNRRISVITTTEVTPSGEVKQWHFASSAKDKRGRAAAMKSIPDDSDSMPSDLSEEEQLQPVMPADDERPPEP